MFLKTRRASLHPVVRLAFLLPTLCCPVAALAQSATEVPSASNYGGAGLIDMRTARFYPDGFLVVSTSFAAPDDRYAITFQAVPWAEFTFRYSINQAIRDGNVALHDRSFDVKFRLANETQYVPEIALGFQDILGTGVYSGEYLVGSKRWGAFDFSLGLGWGRLGSRGTFENPFSLVSDRFLSRPTDVGVGGLPLLRSYFRGPDAGLFGGVEYATPIKNVTLKVEYSSDAYLVEKSHTGHDYGAPINVGVSYRPDSWLDVSVSLIHGRTVGLRIATFLDPTSEVWRARLDPAPRFVARPEEVAGTIIQREGQAARRASPSSPETRHVDLTVNETPAAPAMTANGAGPDSPETSLRSAEPALPISPVADAELPAPKTAQPARALDTETATQIGLAMQAQNLVLLGAGIEGDKISIVIENARYRRDSEAIARTARVLSATAPQDVDYFEITLTRAGQPLTTVTVPRTQIDKLARRESSPAELFLVSDLEPGASPPLDRLQPNLFPQLGTFLHPVFRQSLFDPDKPVYVEFGIGATVGLRLSRSWFIESSLVASLYNDFDQIKRASNSDLPHVRSDVAQYLKQEDLGVENLSTSYFFKFAPEIYGRVTGGFIEQMFAGVGGELLYRPFGRRWAIGADLWAVRQRGYDVLFDLRKHEAITGHLSGYYDLPWHDLQLTVSAGQYLAGDKGATFQLSRRFLSGVEIGAWFTLTNVSAAQFGEGSFDKGIRIVIPLEWTAPFATQSSYDLSLRPIQRDGGQRLLGDAMLYGITAPSDYGAVSREWNSVFK